MASGHVNFITVRDYYSDWRYGHSRARLMTIHDFAIILDAMNAPATETRLFDGPTESQRQAISSAHRDDFDKPGNRTELTRGRCLLSSQGTRVIIYRIAVCQLALID